LGIEIINAKKNPLVEEDIRAIVDIKCNLQVREWLYEYGNPTFQKELRDHLEFFRKLTKRMCENVPMRCITEQLGFKFKSLRKERVNKDGVYPDEFVYSMLL
jgi:hypothetical protein